MYIFEKIKYYKVGCFLGGSMLKQIKKFYETNKTTFIVYFILRCLVILSMLLQIIHGNFYNAFLCILTLLLFTIPYFVDKEFSIKLPNVLEIIILLFIFSAEILGEIQNFYGIFEHWDTILHTINGFLCAAIGFSLVDILNRNENFHIKLSTAFVALVAFCFSMTVGVLWEFFEFTMDSSFRTDMQKDKLITSISTIALNPAKENNPIIIDNIKETLIYSTDSDNNLYVTSIKGGYLDIGLIDTMKDLLVNFVGAVTFSIIGILYIKGRDQYNIAEKFIPYIQKNRSGP